MKFVWRNIRVAAGVWAMVLIVAVTLGRIDVLPALVTEGDTSGDPGGITPTAYPSDFDPQDARAGTEDTPDDDAVPVGYPATPSLLMDEGGGRAMQDRSIDPAPTAFAAYPVALPADERSPRHAVEGSAATSGADQAVRQDPPVQPRPQDPVAVPEPDASKADHPVKSEGPGTKPKTDEPKTDEPGAKPKAEHPVKVEHPGAKPKAEHPVKAEHPGAKPKAEHPVKAEHPGAKPKADKPPKKDQVETEVEVEPAAEPAAEVEPAAEATSRS